MPTKTPAWSSKDGMLFTTAEQAAKRDLFVILTEKAGMNTESASACSEVLMDNAAVIVEALTTTGSSRPAARKKAGTTNPKRATKAQAQAGFKAMRDATEAAPAAPIESAA